MATSQALSLRRFVRAFNSENGELSSSKMMVGAAFVVTSVIMLWLTGMGKMTEGYIGAYLGAFTLYSYGNRRINTTPQAPTAKEPDAR